MFEFFDLSVADLYQSKSFSDAEKRFEKLMFMRDFVSDCLSKDVFRDRKQFEQLLKTTENVIGKRKPLLKRIYENKFKTDADMF